MDIVGLISNALGAVKEWLGFQSKRLDLKNTDAMRAAAQAQQEQAAKDRTATEITNQDVNKLRDELAE
jgi:type II secretory pathway pseudopilin PulG